MEPQPTLAAILARRSISPKRLGLPAPTEADLLRMVEAAVTAPDHGGLAPWRFVHIAEEARPTLAATFAAARQDEDRDATAADLERERDKALRGPCLVALVARLSTTPDIPKSEQYVSVGAAAEAFMLAAEALGYGAILLSGRRVHTPRVRAALGLATDESLIGFFTLGRPTEAARPKPRPAATDHFSIWRGPRPHA
ncbi:MAG: nitroreductase [Alphaproteobacteria bacterium]